MKQFHRMILRMLPGPFVAWVLVLLFLLVMQFLIKYLPQLVGKGLPGGVIVELIGYNLAYMLVLAVPMAALIATLMAFGRLAESNAYVVIKSSGVSFPQLVWPVYVVGLLLTAVMWVFNTSIHPESNFRARNLWQDIRTAKPGFDLQAGVFYDGIEDYRILVGNIPLDEPNQLEEVTIYDYSEGARFRTDIHANRGYLEPITDGSTLNLVLFEGEIHRKRPPGSGRSERYERLSFDRHLMRISLDDLNFTRSDPTEGRRTDRTMKSREMIALVDSLELNVAAVRGQLSDLLAGLGTGAITHQEMGFPVRDDAMLSVQFDVASPAFLATASTRELALRTLRASRVRVQGLERDMVWASSQANRYRVEIHKKYSIALACLIFMMIGAPIGLFIRKGGLGVAATLAVAIFMFHWVSLANGEKLADRNIIEPWLGMWLADIVTGIVAIWLTFVVWRDLGSIPSPSFPWSRANRIPNSEAA
jgi:lipopolysaccharide export system permease protein